MVVDFSVVDDVDEPVKSSHFYFIKCNADLQNTALKLLSQASLFQYI